MLNRNKLLLLKFLAILTVFSSTSAFAGMKLSLVGVGDLTSVSSSNLAGADTFSGSFDFGGGALLEFMLSHELGLELGGLYFKRKFSDTNGGVVSDIVSPTVQVPVLLRYQLGHMISLGAGGYLSSGTGTINVTTGGVSQATTFGAYGIKSLDYGVEASLNVSVPLGSSLALVADGRYLMGLSNQVVIPVGITSDSTFKYNDIQVLVGLRINMGGMMSH